MAWFDWLRSPQRAALPATTGAAIVPVDAAGPTPDRSTVFAPPKSLQRPLDEALDADPQKIRAILSEASYGQTRRLIDFGKSARRYDPRLNSVCNTRVLAIGSRPFAIKPPAGLDDDPEAMEIRDFVAWHFDRTRNFPKLKQDLAHGILEPHAVLEHIWTTARYKGRDVYVTQPKWRHPNRFGWNYDGEITKVDPGLDQFPGVPLSNWQNKFIVHAAVSGQSDYPWMRGALRPLLVLSLAGRFGFRWWTQAVERFGQPQVYAKVREGDSNLIDTVLASLRNISSDWRAIVPEGVDFATIPVQVQQELHQRFLDYVNTEKAIQLLGQNLSTEVKQGSYAAAKSQERVRADILAADLAELDETINDQWIRPLVFYNYGPDAPIPYIEHTLESRTPFTLADYQAGVCTLDQYLADTGHDQSPDPERGKAYYVAPAAPASYGGAPMLSAGGAASAAPFPRKSSGTLTSSTSATPVTNPLRTALLRP